MIKITFSLLVTLFLTSCHTESWRDLKYQVAVSDKTYPLSFSDDEGLLQGFEVDLLKRIARELDIEVNLQKVHRNAGSDEILDGDADIAIGAIRLERQMQKFHRMSIPIFDASAGFICLRSQQGKFQTKQDLFRQSYLMGFIKNDAESAALLQKLYPQSEAIALDSLPALKRSMTSGKIDLAILPPVKVWPFRDNPDFAILPIEINQIPFGFYYAPQHDELAQRIDRLLDQWKKDGTLTTMLDRWFLMSRTVK